VARSAERFGRRRASCTSASSAPRLPQPHCKSLDKNSRQSFFWENNLDKQPAPGMQRLRRSTPPSSRRGRRSTLIARCEKCDGPFPERPNGSESTNQSRLTNSGRTHPEGYAPSVVNMNMAPAVQSSHASSGFAPLACPPRHPAGSHSWFSSSGSQVGTWHSSSKNSGCFGGPRAGLYRSHGGSHSFRDLRILSITVS
jgi:hypothetical protein